MSQTAAGLHLRRLSPKPTPMTDKLTSPPWQLCDHATRVGYAAMTSLNKVREHDGISIETLSARSGLGLMATTRTMRGHGCNLAEFLALCAALGLEAPSVIAAAAFTTEQTDPSDIS